MADVNNSGTCVDGGRADLVVSGERIENQLDQTDACCHGKGRAVGGGGGGSSGGSGSSAAGKFSDPSTIEPPSSLSELIATLHEVFAGDDICVEYVQELMASYQSKPQEWKTFAKFDKYKYTRNLVDEGNNKFNLMILCWNEAQGSSIHSHANSHCFLKVLDGEIKENLYHWPNTSSTKTTTTTASPCNSNKIHCKTNEDEEEKSSTMRKKGEARFGKNECAYINDSIGLHRVENESHSNKAVTLHLYSPPFQECQCFDQRNGHVTTSQMTFWSKFGTRTPYGKNLEMTEQLVEDN